MKRTRYIKIRMAAGLSKSQAAAEAQAIQHAGASYEDVARLSQAFSRVAGALVKLGASCISSSSTMRV